MDVQFSEGCFAEAFAWPQEQPRPLAMSDAELDRQIGVAESSPSVQHLEMLRRERGRRKPEQFAHPLGIEPTPVRVPAPEPRQRMGPFIKSAHLANSILNSANPHPSMMLAGLYSSGALLNDVRKQAQNYMDQRSTASEQSRQEAINHRLALNNELEDVSEEEAEQVRNFLATLRHG